MKTLLALMLLISFSAPAQILNPAKPPKAPRPFTPRSPKAPNSGVKIDFLKVGRLIRDRLPKKNEEKESEEEKQARIRRLMDDAARERVNYAPVSRGSS